MKLTDEVRIGILVGLYCVADEKAHTIYRGLMTLPGWLNLSDIASQDPELAADLEREAGLVK